MTDSIKFIVEADGRAAEATLDGLVASTKRLSDAQVAASRRSAAFDALGIRSKHEIQLEIARTEAAYKRLAASGSTSAGELARAETAARLKVTELKAEINGTVPAANKAGSSLAGVGKTLIGLFAAHEVAAGFREIISAGVDLQRTMNALEIGTGDAQKSFDYVKQTAITLGLDLQTAASQFASFSAATKGSALEGENTAKVFHAVATAGTALHLSTEQMSGALLALNQMASKGTVQMEELRGQLGERIPGAFHMAAVAMGMTDAELNKAISNGNVLASDLLPKLADVLEQRFGDTARTASGQANAQFNRLNTALFDLRVSIADSGLLEATGKLAGLFANAADGAAMFIDQLSGKKSPDTIAVEISGINDRIAELQTMQKSAEGKAVGWLQENLFGGKSTEQQIADLRKQADALQKEREAMIAKAVAPTKKPEAAASTGHQATMQAQQQAARELKAIEKQYSALSDLSRTFYADDQQKADAAYAIKTEKLNAQYKKLFDSEALSDTQRQELKSQHIAALAIIDQQHEAQTIDIHQRLADKIEQDDIASQQRRLQNLRDYYQTSLDLQGSFGSVFSDTQQTNIDNLTQQIKTFANTMKKIDTTTWQGRISIVRGALTAASSLMESHNRKQFEVGKAAAIANSVVATLQGATQAYKDVPFPFNIAAAGVILAAGFANVQKISSTPFGGGSAGAAAGAGGNVSPGAVGAAPAPTPVTPVAPQPTLQQQAGPSIHVTVAALDPSSVTPAALQNIGDALAPIVFKNFGNNTQQGVIV